MVRVGTPTKGVHVAVASDRRKALRLIDNLTKEISMSRSIFGLTFRIGREKRARSRRFEARLEDLESRNLMTGGSVVQSGLVVTVNPAATGPNIAIVSFQNVNGTKMVDVNLNGSDHYFSAAKVGFVYYMGSGASGAQTFENETSLDTIAWGGSGRNLFESSTGNDEFIGGSGSNTFDAGSGYDVLIGGTGTNAFNEDSSGSGVVFQVGGNNLIVSEASSEGYYVF
jgi:Ca2+-binding RTX toxin-like protein